mgnify:FL=1|tara:strand:- start:4164 stop:4442 length:279 start_codon:yes stop_codon:yes gene_type:complete
MSAPKRYDFTSRKSVHIHLEKKFHGAFRAALLSHGVTMQDALEECAIRIAESDSYMENLLNDIINKKAEGELSAAKEEIESIYDIIKKDRKN